MATDLFATVQQSTGDPAYRRPRRDRCWPGRRSGGAGWPRRPAPGGRRGRAEPGTAVVRGPAIGADRRGARPAATDASELAAAGARPDVDPQFREIAPLLDAYARYWAGRSAGRRRCVHGIRGVASRTAGSPTTRSTPPRRRSSAPGATPRRRPTSWPSPATNPRPPASLSSRLVALDGRALLREGCDATAALGIARCRSASPTCSTATAPGTARRRARRRAARPRSDRRRRNAGAPGAGRVRRATACAAPPAPRARGDRTRRASRRATRSRVPRRGDATPSGDCQRAARSLALGSVRGRRRSCWRSRSVGSRDGDLRGRAVASDRADGQRRHAFAGSRTRRTTTAATSDADHDDRRAPGRSCPVDVAQVAGRGHADRLRQHDERARAATRSRRSAGARTPRPTRLACSVALPPIA